ncbi:MAG: hypothetical protein KKA62_00660 [Nanoarchaeota archaeon]|nr:hypothetical protein [Nanoarchaeota archaeon]MBU1976445.1 hypothetical protein [Nanoarchaeota archaeon]
MVDKIEAIILDWAGTTMDLWCVAPVEAFKWAFKEVKDIELTFLEVRQPMGKNKLLHIQELLQMDSVQQKWLKAYGRVPDVMTEANEIFESFVPKQIEILKKYNQLIPGTLDSIREFRERGVEIGSTTGYTNSMMKILLAESKKQGYFPDVVVCSEGGHYVRKGNSSIYTSHDLKGRKANLSRPGPGMCNLNAALLGVSDNAACLKLGDTLDDCREGIAAGMWTGAFAGTGNEMYMLEDEIHLTEEEAKARDLDGYSKKLLAGFKNMSEIGYKGKIIRPDIITDGIKRGSEVHDLVNRLIGKGLEPGEYAKSHGSIWISNDKLVMKTYAQRRKKAGHCGKCCKC